MKLVVATELKYPIILSADGRAMNGMYRLAKAIIEGKSHILAVRFLAAPEPDYVGVRRDDLPYDDA